MPSDKLRSDTLLQHAKVANSLQTVGINEPFTVAEDQHPSPIPNSKAFSGGPLISCQIAQNEPSVSV